MGGLNIFRRKYAIRRFGEQKIVNGFPVTPFTDSVAMLNVQPLEPDEMQALPEGERQFKRLKTYGDLQLTAADQQRGTPGDWLYYYGRWYKCVSAVPWDHTMLAHCQAEFAAVAETEPAANTAPPTVEV